MKPLKAQFLVGLCCLAGLTHATPQQGGITMNSNNIMPELLIEDYFKGKTWAWGVFEDRFGNLKNCYTVEMDGHFSNRLLTLDERFTYQDGSESTRVWQIEVLDNGQYQGTADDVIGKAKGHRSGNTFRWGYTLELPISGSSWRLAFDDRLYLQRDGVLMNIARVSKWGIGVGQLTFAFSKSPKILQQACSDDGIDELTAFHGS